MDLVDSFYKVPSNSRETNLTRVHVSYKLMYMSHINNYGNDRSAQILYKWLHQRKKDQYHPCEKSFSKLESLFMLELRL